MTYPDTPDSPPQAASDAQAGLDDSTCGVPGEIGWRDCPLGQEVFIIHNRMMKIADRIVAHLGLTGSRWLLLGALERYEDPPTLSALSEDALLSVQNVSRMVAAMEEDGLVERFNAPGQGRATFVRMTERGVEVKRLAREQGRRFSNVMLRGMDESEVEETRRVLHLIIGNLERFEELDPGGDRED